MKLIAPANLPTPSQNEEKRTAKITSSRGIPKLRWGLAYCSVPVSSSIISIGLISL